MKWFNFLKSKNAGKNKMAMILNGRAPIFSQFGQEIYASDVVQQAMFCIVNEVKKLIPKHIQEQGGLINEINDSVNMVLQNPNPLMTTGDFLEKITWQLLLKYNVFIYPEYELVPVTKGRYRKAYKALYPLNPQMVEFLSDENEKIYVKMRFSNGLETFFDYAELIHLRYRYSVSPFMGGNEQGQPDNEALLKILQINSDLMEGVSRNAKYTINGVITYGSLFGQEALEESRIAFEKAIKNNESGILPLDLGGTYTPLSRDAKLVDKDTLQFIDEKILRHIGVSMPVLLGTATVEQKQAFFERTIEPIVISMNQSFSKTMISNWQKNRNHKILFYHKDLMFMSADQTINMIKEVGGRGALTNNQILAAFGYPPYEGGNVRLMSLNYVDVSIANQYQLNSGEGGKNDETQ